jgi:chromosome segregation ATPase
VKSLELAILPVLATGLLFTGACNRERAEQTSATPAAGQMDAERQQYISRLEQRISELDGRLTQMRQAEGRQAVSEDRIEEIQEDLKSLREEVAELRTANQEDWWASTERSIERDYRDLQEDINQDTGTRARTEPERTMEPAPGTANWMARRDQFVTRMNSEVEALERDLERLRGSSRAGAKDEYEDVREELDDLKSEIAAVRDTTADTWWERTRQRLDRSFNRLERSIENIGDDREPRRQ